MMTWVDVGLFTGILLFALLLCIFGDRDED
jgi:hypothetical protein